MPTFVYNLPFKVKSDLAASLNAGEAWKDLAGSRLGYGSLDIQRFSEARYKPASSPAEALLTTWGQRNGTAEELFKHLHALGLYRSMYIIKDHVPESLHGFLQGPQQKQQQQQQSYATSPDPSGAAWPTAL